MTQGIVRTESELPKKVQEHLRNERQFGERFLLALKTKYRLTPDYPYCWLVLTTLRLLICSTHRSGVHHAFKLKQVNSVTIEGADQIRILPNDLSDIVLPLPSKPDGQVEEVVKEIDTTVHNHAVG